MCTGHITELLLRAWSHLESSGLHSSFGEEVRGAVMSEHESDVHNEALEPVKASIHARQ